MEILQFGSNIQGEMGNWTPTAGSTGAAFSTPSYSSPNGQKGRYVKIGNLTLITWQLIGTLQGPTYPSGNIRILGIPFTPVNDSNALFNNIAALCNIAAEGISGIPEYFILGTVNAICLGLQDNSLNGNIVNNQVSWNSRGGTSFSFRGSLIYEAA